MYVTKPTCSIPVCDEPAYGRGWCKAHHARWCAKGDPGTTPIRKKRPGSICSVEGCSRAHYARDLCRGHYQRVRKGHEVGGPAFILTPTPDDMLTYRVLHQRIASARGSASDHTCPCGAQAKHWAYQHNDPAPLMDKETGMSFSPDVHGCYEAMCVPCHWRMDHVAGRSGWLW